MGRVDPGESSLQRFLWNPKYIFTFSRILATSTQTLVEVNMIPTFRVLKLNKLDWLFPFSKAKMSPFFSSLPTQGLRKIEIF